MKRTFRMTAVTLATVTLLWACSNKNGALEIGTLFLNAMSVGDCETAKKYATKESENSLNMLNGVSKGKKANPDKIEIGKLEEAGNSAKLHYLENGAPRILNLVKIGEDWKVNWLKTNPGEGAMPMDSSRVRELEIPLR